MLKFLSRFSTLIFTLIFIGLFLAFSAVWYFSSDLPDYKFLQNYKPAVSSKVYDINGNIFADFSKEKRTFIKYEQIPDKIIHAFISAEDKNFFSHPGIDAVGITRAIIKNVQHFITGQRLEGASTITQQVAKNLLLSSEVSLARKVKEAILAFRIEKYLNKKRILELYLNEIYLGERSYGIASASMVYFDKSVKELNFAEAALLASLPKAPSKYNPYKNVTIVKDRVNWVLHRMYENKYISEADLKKNLSLPFKLKKREFEQKDETKFFAEEVRKSLLNIYGEENVYKQGLYIKTSLDPDLQNLAVKSLRKHLLTYDKRHGWRGPFQTNKNITDFKTLLLTPNKIFSEFELAFVYEVNPEKALILLKKDREGTIPLNNLKWAKKFISKDQTGKTVENCNEVLKVGDIIYVQKTNNAKEWLLEQIPSANGGAIVMDPWNGRVFALVGGFDFDLNQFNRATQAKRQPGSAFKPFVYSVALENGFKPNSIILDAPFVKYENKTEFKWKPKNYGEKFYGPSLFRVGVEQSRNLMTIRIADQIGINKINSVAKKLGIYQKTDDILSVALGASETTLMDLTSAYSTFVNGGRKVTPTLIDLIQDKDGIVKFKNNKLFCLNCNETFDINSVPLLDSRYDRIFEESTAYQMVNILKGVVDRGTAKKIRYLNMELAGKTGTTNDNFDAWFIGFTPNLLVGVFVGFDEPSSLGKFETGAKAALPIFEEIIKNTKQRNDLPFFKPASTVKLVKIDKNKGTEIFTGNQNAITESFKINDEVRNDDNYKFSNSIY